jgi:periplasmic protein TonB
MWRPPAATLLASIAAHGGAVALLFVLTSGESHPSVLFVDLEALEEREAPVAGAGSAAGGGGEATRVSTGSARTAGRDGGRSGPARSPAPAPAVSSPVTPPALPEPALVREREEAQPANQEARQPEPAVATVPARDVPPDVPPSPSTGAARENAGGAFDERVASTSEPGGGGRAAPGPGMSGAGPGGAGGGTGLASGGSGGGAPGAEYGGYLAGVRRRILDALRYPPPARSRGLTGTVYLEIFIKSDGAIGDVSVTSSSSHPLLDEAALEAVRSLEPQPFPRGLKPRLLRVRLPVVFDLQ